MERLKSPVTPANAGVHVRSMDTGLRRYDVILAA